jgi:hypothetical protein
MHREPAFSGKIPAAPFGFRLVAASLVCATVTGVSAAVAGGPSPALGDPLVSAPQAGNTFTLRPAGHAFGMGFTVTGSTPWTTQSLAPSGTFTGPGLRTGFEVSMSNAWALGGLGDEPLYFEWNTSVGLTSASGSTSTALSGPVFLSFGSPPEGSIDATTDTSGGTADASTNASVLDGSGDSATINSSASSGPGGSVSQVALSTTNEGGVFTAETTDGSAPTAAAYGAIFDKDGFAFAAAGDLGDTSLVTDWSDSQFSLETEVLIGRAITSGTDWSIFASAGPSFTFTDRTLRRTERFVIDPVIAGVDPIELSLSTEDRLTTRSYGGTAGVTFTRLLSPDWGITLGMSGGLDYFDSDYVGTSAVSVPARPTGIPTAFNLQGNSTSMSLQGVSGRVAASVKLSHYLESGGVLGLSLFGDYAWNVPTIATRTTGSTPGSFGAGSASYSGTGAPFRETYVTTGTSWSVGVGVSYGITF